MSLFFNNITQQVQNKLKHVSDVILKPNHAHLALAARFCSDVSAARIALCSKM